jgi:hypothetical protein
MKLLMRSHLLPLQQEALLVAGRIRSQRDHALFTLALGAGMAARAIAALDVGHVSRDGVSIRAQIENSPPGRRGRSAGDDAKVHVLLPRHVRPVLADHLASIKASCPHFSRSARDAAGSDGDQRCATCGLATDFLKVPLFLSRGRTRLSAPRIRSLFAQYRGQLRLPERLNFDSLKATFDLGRVTDLRAA